jgi:hypothetical protein
MGLETGTTIASFISSNPTSADPVNEGDNHLRLIKSVLKAQFPGAGGLGYATAITATEAELNALHGLTNYYFPSGTRMPFAQAAAPTGWTQDTTDKATNRMLRVVNTAGNGVGGTDSPILNNKTMVAHTHAFTGNALTAHTHTDSGHAHTVAYYTELGGGGSGKNTGLGASSYSTSTSSANISSNSAGTPTGSISSTAAVSWTPKYIDMIICSKN